MEKRGRVRDALWSTLLFHRKMLSFRKRVAQIEYFPAQPVLICSHVTYFLTNRIWEKWYVLLLGKAFNKSSMGASAPSPHLFPFCQLDVWCWGLRECGSGKVPGVWMTTERGATGRLNALLGTWARQTFTVSEHYTYGSLYHSLWVYTEKQNTPSLSQRSGRAEKMVKRWSPRICVHLDSGTLLFTTRLSSWTSKNIQIIFSWARCGHPFWVGDPVMVQK